MPPARPFRVSCVVVAAGLSLIVERGETVRAATTAAPQALTVSAAISLSDVLRDIAGAFHRAGGAPVRFNLASSNALARQIINGAPVDVFISADEAQMKVAEAAGAMVKESAVVVAANQLAIVALPERMQALARGLSRGDIRIRRLAIGDPSAVPAGVYARAYLERKGLWETYRSRIVPTTNVRAALAAVENGGADAAIVYVTDARRSTVVAVAFTIPTGETPFIGYQAAIVARSPHREQARAFLAFLRGPQAGRLFEKHGFLPVPAGH